MKPFFRNEGFVGLVKADLLPLDSECFSIHLILWPFLLLSLLIYPTRNQEAGSSTKQDLASLLFRWHTQAHSWYWVSTCWMNEWMNKWTNKQTWHLLLLYPGSRTKICLDLGPKSRPDGLKNDSSTVTVRLIWGQVYARFAKYNSCFYVPLPTSNSKCTWCLPRWL